MINNYNYYAQLCDKVFEDSITPFIKILHPKHGHYQVHYHDTIASGTAKSDDYALQIACKRMLDNWFIKIDSKYKNLQAKISEGILPIFEHWMAEIETIDGTGVDGSPEGPRQLGTLSKSKPSLVTGKQIYINTGFSIDKYKEIEPPSLIDFLLIHAKAWLSLINPIIYIESLTNLKILLTEIYNFSDFELSFEKKKNNRLKVNNINLSVCYFKILNENFDKSGGNSDFSPGFGYTGIEAKLHCSFKALARLKAVEDQFLKKSKLEILRDPKLKYFYCIFGQKIFDDSQKILQQTVSQPDLVSKSLEKSESSISDKKPVEESEKPVVEPIKSPRPDFKNLSIEKIIPHLDTDLINHCITHLYAADEDEGAKAYERGFLYFINHSGIKFQINVENKMVKEVIVPKCIQILQNSTGGGKLGKSGKTKNGKNTKCKKGKKQAGSKKEKETEKVLTGIEKPAEMEIRFEFKVKLTLLTKPMITRHGQGKEYKQACNLAAIEIFKVISKIVSKF